MYASVTDQDGTVVPSADRKILFSIEGDARLIGTNPKDTEAGISAILLQAGKTPGMVRITASADGLKSDLLELNVK